MAKTAKHQTTSASRSSRVYVLVVAFVLLCIVFAWAAFMQYG